MDNVGAPAITTKILQFLREIGLEARPGPTGPDTVLPGIDIRDGALIWDEARLKHPGDLLHEAGHLALKAPAARAQTTHSTGDDPGEEMAAIAWSYAAALHLGFSPGVVVHSEGYNGGSAALIEIFAAKRYLGVPLLAYYGLTENPPRRSEINPRAYPVMAKWVR